MSDARSIYRAGADARLFRELERQNRVSEPVHEQERISTSDPDTVYATKGGRRGGHESVIESANIGPLPA